jgi:hypothetical protein
MPPLQSISVPLLPLRAASRGSAGLQWPQPLPLDGLDAIEEAPALLHAWLQEVASAAPVVLLVDDLQWADESTLDVLMYLVAGPVDRGSRCWLPYAASPFLTAIHFTGGLPTRCGYLA